jgi:hypothetical protein
MVNIQVRRSSPGCPIVWGVPGSGVGVAVAANGEVGSVTVQHRFTGVAVARDGDPVRK